MWPRSDTRGNLYTTSLHVINSAVLKLGKLARAATVYRGISKTTLPPEMLAKDEAHNTRGGIEFGFTSCSKLKEEAVRYATEAKGRANTTPILLEIQMGMVDCGADLSWLSPVSYTHLTLPTTPYV